MTMESSRSEFAGRGWLVAACACCTSLGAGATMFYSLGAFIPQLQAEFGWSRGQLSLGATVMSIAIFLFGPVAGHLSDRWGSARVCAVSFGLYALSLFLLAGTLNSLTGFLLLYLLIAATGSGVMPVTIVRPLIQSFERSRGLALGLAMTGAGLAAFWVPQFVTIVSRLYGWRAAYVGIGLLALIAIPVAHFGLRPKAVARAEEDGPSRPAVEQSEGDWKNRRFAVMMAIGLAMGTGVAGLIVHLIPLLLDAGMTAFRASLAASLIGLSSVASRFVVGPLLDRWNAALVTTLAISLAIVGLVLLLIDPVAAAIPAAILIGVCLGAEADALAFLTAKLFGDARYSTIYGWIFGAFTLGYGISPFCVGGLYDLSGTYTASILFSIVLLSVSMILCWTLRKAVPGRAAA